MEATRYYGPVAMAMAAYDRGDPHRIGHFLKVAGFCGIIAAEENLDPGQQALIEVAALTHDIGIRNSLRQYQSAAAPYQEALGPPEAERMLTGLGLPQPMIERVCWLIGHHHQVDSIQGIDHQILVEADFLVNAAEGKMARPAILHTRERLFQTRTGRALLNQEFALDE